MDLGPPAETLPQIFGSRTIVAQWGMTPVIDATELRLLRIAYRRALGSPEMPDPEFLDELAHELKNQFPSNADQRDESELFYEYAQRGVRDYAELDARITTTNDDEVCNGPEALASARSPLARDVCRKLDVIQRDLARIRPGWFHVGGKRDVPQRRLLRRPPRQPIRLGRPRRPRGPDRVHPDSDEALLAHQGDPDAAQPRTGEVLAR